MVGQMTGGLNDIEIDSAGFLEPLSLGTIWEEKRSSDAVIGWNLGGCTMTTVWQWDWMILVEFSKR